MSDPKSDITKHLGKSLLIIAAGMLAVATAKAASGNGMSLPLWGFNDVRWVMLPLDTACAPENGSMICRQESQQR